jgi:PAS domain S-box-containing protein
MLKAPVFDSQIELARLNELNSFEILDTPLEEEYEKITFLAAQICQTPISLISLVDDKRQWFKSHYGLEATQTPRDISYCGHAIAGDDVFIVEDASKDKRFFDNPLYLQAPHVKFYAGVPLITSSGNKLGTLCVIDKKEKKLSDDQLKALKALATQVCSLLDLRKKNIILREIKKQFEDVQLITKTGYWTLDTKTSETTWTDAIYDIYNIPRNTPTNLISGISYYAPYEREKLQNYLNSTIQKNQHFESDFEFIDAKSNKKWVKVIAHPLEANGAVSKVIGTIQDITEKKMIENKLKENHQYLSLALEGANLGIWDWNLENNAVKFDRRWAEMLGQDIQEIKMELATWETRVHKDDLAKCYTDIKSYMDGKTPYYENIHRMKHKNGSWVYILDRGKFSDFNSEGKPIRFTGTHLDITKQKQTELIQLEISDLRAKFIKLNDDKHSFYNDLLERILKLTDSEYGFIGEVLENQQGKYLKSLAISDISWDENSSNLFRESKEKGLMFTNLQTLFGEVIISQKPLIANDAPHHPKAGGIPTGHPALKKFLGIPLFYQNQYVGMVGVANRENGYNEDILEFLKPLTDIIGDMINHIRLKEDLQYQKQIALHNAKLASLGEMASGIGHEINNPLAIISGQTQLIEKQLNDGSISKDSMLTKISKIKNNIERIIHIIHGLKSFARADKNEFVKFDVNTLLYETVEMMRELFKSDNIIINYQIVKEEFLMNGNRGRLQQVIVNMINNAKDATKDMKDKNIWVNASSDDKYIYIAIKDNGSGMSDETKRKIFEPFFTTKPLGEGTGIGLSISNSIIKDIGGEIKVQSKIGVGTEFKIILPKM